MLNVLFGIIINTFAELRDQKARIDNDMVNVCFICNNPRLVFDKYCEGGFERHIEKDHNLWSYVFYMVHLDSKDTSDHTGVESNILQKYREKDITWIPRSRALCLMEIMNDEQEAEADEEFKDQLKDWNKGIVQIEKQLNNLLKQIETKEEEEAKKNKDK